MGLIPRVSEPTPAFVHVDVDDLWAVAECYGYGVDPEWAHHITRDALPRFGALFQAAGIQATFFIVGRDLSDTNYTSQMKTMVAAGHRVANHSYTHRLDFRALANSEIEAEVDQCHQAIADKLSVVPTGFRAPGYAWSRQLMDVLANRNYKYDASLMPGPYGGVFRYLDSRLAVEKAPKGAKTQYPLMGDTWNSLYPGPVQGHRLIEIPSAASPLLRLPFQAGVCMRLGYAYFRACLQPYRWNRALPLTFLFHAADLADFSPVPHELFRRSTFFNKPIAEREMIARRFITAIQELRPVRTTEDWLQ